MKNILKDKFPSLTSDYLTKLISYITSQKDRASRCSSLAREEASKCSFTAQVVSNDSKDKALGPKSGHTAAKKKAQENAVIKIIQKEWEKEMERLDFKKNGVHAKNPNCKHVGDKSLVQSGHAEIESNRILYIYGNALEVLQRSEFFDVVEEMHLTYVRFDLIVYYQHLEKLRKFKKLKKLVLTHNALNSFILLSKIECLQSLEQLYIYDNEILQAATLKAFVIYRFQHIVELNGFLVTEEDKKRAKQQFQLFDKILSIQNVFTKKVPAMQNADSQKRQELRKQSKKNGEIAGEHVQSLIEDIIGFAEDKESLGTKVYVHVEEAVRATTCELTQGSGLEKQMKKSCLHIHKQQTLAEQI